MLANNCFSTGFLLVGKLRFFEGLHQLSSSLFGWAFFLLNCILCRQRRSTSKKHNHQTEHYFFHQHLAIP